MQKKPYCFCLGRSECDVWSCRNQVVRPKGIYGNGAWDNPKRGVINMEQPTIVVVVPINGCDGRGTAGGELGGDGGTVPCIIVPGVVDH
jgi:hypothetical protein